MEVFTFRLSRHTIRNVEIVDILKDGEVVGVMYPTAEGVRIISAHVSDGEKEEGFGGEMIYDDGKSSFPPIPAVIVNFKPQHYLINSDGIKKIKPS